MGVRSQIVAYCRRQIGCSYDYTPSGGVEGSSYNCSYLTACAYRAAGLTIPTWQGHQNGSGSQSDWVRWHGHWTTDPSKLKAGDLVFFGSSPYNTGHVGVSLGGRYMIDSVPSGGVRQRTLYSSFVGGGWPLADYPDDSDSEGVFDLTQTITVKTRSVAVRTAPSTSTGKIVARYSKGDTFVVDGVKVANGYIWGTYVGNSGNRRYVALGPSSIAG